MTLTLASRIILVDATIRFFLPSGERATRQCVGGMYNYGGTVKSNRAAYMRKMHSQVRRGLLRLPASVTAEFTLNSGADQYVERFNLIS
jgi:hypothetical protein